MKNRALLFCYGKNRNFPPYRSNGLSQAHDFRLMIDQMPGKSGEVVHWEFCNDVPILLTSFDPSILLDAMVKF